MAELQPFLISEFKTGLFNYLEPWIRPQDAFEELENAFIYRGTLNKRKGYSVFGRIAYQDVIATGNGGKVYSGTLSTNPIVPGSFTPTDGTETFTDDGNGVLTGSMGGTGTINYTTGAWTLTFNANVISGTLITASYNPIKSRPIMGIKQWTNETTGERKCIIMDTRRAAVFNNGAEVFEPLSTIDQIIYQGDGSTTSITVNANWVNVAPYTNVLAPFSISITDGTSTIVDDGAGNLTSSGNFAAGGTVDYTNSDILLNFSAAPASTVFITLTATLVGDYFSGDQTNFFNATNWLGKMYMVNDQDAITLYDGTTSPGTLSRPPFPITQANKLSFTNNIGTALDIDVYKNRLIVQRPVLVNNNPDNGIQPQSFRYSAIQNPTNLVADVTGNGGELSAPTDDFIQSSEFLRDQLIVFFNNSVWTFRFTGSDFAPFRWDKINSTKSTNAPYGTIPYDERITAMGSKGLIACDGANVQRYDVSVIDQFLDIDQQYYGQCFGQRFDTTNQSWMLFPSVGSSSGLSDQVLIYNFLENTWAIYDIPLSCLGLFYVTHDVTWADFAPGQPLGDEFPNWQSAEFTWNSYLNQELAPNLLAGSLSGGYVYQMDTGTQDHPESNDVGVNYEATISSSRWNPFTNLGQKVQFAYIDFYYSIDPQTPPATISLSFFTDNSTAPALNRTLTLDGPTNQTQNFKRIYINCIGQFLQMGMSSSDESNFQILGMVLWAKQSGRITPR
jgi:hypothetical protein